MAVVHTQSLARNTCVIVFWCPCCWYRWTYLIPVVSPRQSSWRFPLTGKSWNISDVVPGNSEHSVQPGAAWWLRTFMAATIWMYEYGSYDLPLWFQSTPSSPKEAGPPSFSYQLVGISWCPAV